MDIKAQVFPKFLTAFDLKVIAIVTMLIDHVARVFYIDSFPEGMMMKGIGRTVFVLFSFLLVEGFVHTRHIKSYMLKLALWALLSEIPYDLAINGKLMDLGSQNIFFTLLSGLVCLAILKTGVHYAFKLLSILLIAYLAYIFRFDYLYLGVLQIVVFYLFRDEHAKKYVSVALMNVFAWGRLSLQSAAVLAIVPISLYNGERGYKAGNMLYPVYAVHLLVFWLIREYLLK